jgi:acyl-CoA thioesterase
MVAGGTGARRRPGQRPGRGASALRRERCSKRHDHAIGGVRRRPSRPAPALSPWKQPRARPLSIIVPMEADHSFTRLLAQRRADGDSLHYTVGGDWLQGRTCYGGLIAALAVQAMRELAGREWPAAVGLRALQTSFVGPVSPGEVEVQVRRLRQGRHVAQVQALVLQGGQVAAALLGVFGADRPSSLPQRLPQRPTARREAHELPPPPPRPAGAPVFLEHFDMRWADGPPPYTGGSGFSTSIHMRLKPSEASELPAELQTVLLADLPPTPVIGQLRSPTANSSVSWALELRPLAAAPGDGWWRADCESLLVDGGYVNHAARLWAPDGGLAAYGYQVVAVFG